jgi:hypothetical protein
MIETIHFLAHFFNSSVHPVFVSISEKFSMNQPFNKRVADRTFLHCNYHKIFIYEFLLKRILTDLTGLNIMLGLARKMGRVYTETSEG